MFGCEDVLKMRQHAEMKEKKEETEAMNPTEILEYYSERMKQGAVNPMQTQSPSQSKEKLLEDLRAASRRISLLCMGYRESSPYFKQAMKAESEQPIVDTDWDE